MLEDLGERNAIFSKAVWDVLCKDCKGRVSNAKDRMQRLGDSKPARVLQAKIAVGISFCPSCQRKILSYVRKNSEAIRAAQ